ncbi:hypothetical protein OG393_01330 [Streptomyces sp. NBC_01216]|uniref:hypothetical protein n=1 Tax=Streptomyces sp. NBC_01216 TaxID=2903778 RepID=UPI002E0DC422|nr:hypothetical protein OG393_01330 [Streptomyces sp. NBC_01216]
MSLTAPPAPAPRITYGAVLGSPYVTRLLGGTLASRLPNGMAPVAILLWATTNGGSIAFGGLLSALYGLSSALAQPVKGRLMDRTSEAYAWLILAIGTGQSVGTALAGRLAEQPLTTAALPAAGAAFALVVLLAARRRLGPAAA